MTFLLQRFASKLVNLANRLAEKRHFRFAYCVIRFVYHLEGKNDTNKILIAATWALKGKLYKKAIKCLNFCIKEDIQVEKALQLLGVVYRLSKDYKNAIRVHKKCLEISSEDNYADILYLLGEDYEKFGETENAKRYYKDAIERDPIKHKAYFRLADIYIAEQEYKKAIKLLLEGLKIYESDEQWIKLVLCYLLTKQLSAARRIIDKLIEKRGYNDFTLYVLALYYINEKNYQKVEEIYEKLRHNIDLSQALKIKLLLEKKEYKRLLDILKNVQRKKRNGEYWYFRSVVEAKVGKENKALRSIRKAIKMQPALKKKGLKDVKMLKMIERI